ncbi:MAG TPA: serpin family protein [Mucilaginibacter sp.]|jgi:serpin B|nr:serpin family protein [Mucilaginibacter sp.]
MKLICKTPPLFFALLIGLASCHKDTKVTPLLPGKNLVLTAYEQQKVTADNAFSLRLFKSVDSTITDGSNLFISPLSVSFALGMTSNGAKNATLTAFQRTLNFEGLTQTQINTYYNNLITNLPQLDPNTTLDIANSIWYKQGFSVLPQFLQTDSSSFHAQVQALDFNSAAAPGTINNWVSTNTNGFIPTIIKSIPSNAVMYLVNAIYFKSAWNEKFDPTQTKNSAFYLPDNTTVQAPFMTGDIDVNYYADSKAFVYELPYSDNKFSMVIVEPAAGTSLTSLIPSIDSAQWQTWMSSLHPVKNTVTLPKLKFSFGALLNQPLTDMGLGIAFTTGADFTGINASPGYQLHISQVVHKAFVETDESGTTAAAATSVGVVAEDAPPPLPPINHPFVFAIREKSSGIILFIGTVNNPLLQGN